MMQNELKQQVLQKVFIDSSTGEVFTGREIRTTLLEDMAKKRLNQLEGLRSQKSKDEFHVLMAQCLGEFYFAKYSHIIDLFVDDLGVFDSATAFRFIYLTTYMDYDNRLLWGSYYNNKHHDFMLERDLHEVLKLSKPHVIKFKQKVVDLGLLIINEDKTLSISKKCCIKGKLPKKQHNSQHIRIFERGIQDLYKNSKPTEHKKLGLFIELIPYLNTQHNILCHAPSVGEEYAPRICPINIQDICEICCYHPKNARRLEKELLKITVNGEFLMMKHTRGDCYLYSVNPKLFYKGRNKKSLQALINLFDAGKQ